MMGHEVCIAEDGPSAHRERRPISGPEVALLDLGLPGLSGYEVARTLRADAHYEDLVLVAQTGWGQEEDRRRSREAGFDHHLVKPVGPEELRAVLDSKRSAS